MLSLNSLRTCHQISVPLHPICRSERCIQRIGCGAIASSLKGLANPMPARDDGKELRFRLPPSPHF